MGAKPAEEKQWDIFLSYSSKDKIFVDWLYNKLCNAGLEVWYDEHEILAGDAIPTMISKGLKESEFLIVVISKQAVKSTWVGTELETKIFQQVEKDEVIILPVILGDIGTEEIPQFLRSKKWIQFPHEDWDEKLKELLVSIKGQLERRSLKVPPRLNEIVEQPAQQNPYPFGLRNGIDPAYFVVHESVVKLIIKDIVDKQSVFIVGASMLGKTSLLNFLASPLCQVYYQRAGSSRLGFQFSYLDVQELSGESRDKLIIELARRMPKSASGHFDGRTYKEALKWIKDITGRKKPGSPFWILRFDEFDQVVELDKIDKTFFDNIRSLAENHNLCYVIASRRRLLDLPLSQDIKSSPFFRMFSEHELTVWNESTARALMSKPYEKELTAYSDRDFKFIVRLTARHPLLLQIACKELFNLRMNGNNRVDYKQLLERYIQNAKGVYNQYWDYEIGDEEREWLEDCWWALSQKEPGELQRLTSGRNHIIRAKLAKLGLVMSESGPLEIPTGLNAFLKEKFRRR